MAEGDLVILYAHIRHNNHRGTLKLPWRSNSLAVCHQAMRSVAEEVEHMSHGKDVVLGVEQAVTMRLVPGSEPECCDEF